MNTNGRVPAIVDRQADDLTIIDSGAKLYYLAEKTGRLMPKDMKGHMAVMQSLQFKMSAIGPILGQAAAFERCFPENVPAVKKGYHNETRRLYEVLNNNLEHNEWLSGHCFIADIASWSWLRSHKWIRVPAEGLVHLGRWMDLVAVRLGSLRRGLV